MQVDRLPGELVRSSAKNTRNLFPVAFLGHPSCWDYMSLKEVAAGGCPEQASWTEELDVLV